MLLNLSYVCTYLLLKFFSVCCKAKACPVMIVFYFTTWHWSFLEKVSSAKRPNQNLLFV